jgi:excisionase family DNA binding protein
MHLAARTAAAADTRRPARRPAPARRKEAGVPAQPDEWLTVDEVIAELRVPRSTFYRWRQAGTGPAAVKLPSGAVRIRRTALEEWLAGLEDNPREHAA